ncbi:MAG: cytochrome d ubiquinol oxidase subunit II [Stackebrandtia sp.]
MDLPTVWFTLIAVLWTGYFVLEGFDFGVGALLGVLGRDNATRSTMLGTIGPVWDGNEVWLIVAGGATFAAFPAWYATFFSGFYLPLLVILVALIIRAVGLEYRSKRDDAAWRRRWEACVIAGSIAPAFLWGVAFANMTAGVPINAAGNYSGSVLDLLGGYALLGGVTTLGLFTTHGAVFLALKTTGDLRAAARRTALRAGVITALAAVAFLIWTAVKHSDTASITLSIAAAAALVAAIAAIAAGREGWSFAATAVTIAATVAALFTALFPDVMPSTVDAGYGLTAHGTASTPYTLKIMTIVAGIFTPLVLLYQGWTYWVFRRRLSVPRDNGVKLPQG